MISSPCVNICKLDPGRTYCTGCNRTLDEIGRWSSMSEKERLAVMERLKALRK
jgi:predicted Fe-S protein YdhL (DUF1289 family)